MATLETIDKTANTAAAITRATESHTVLQAANLKANLRLSNLEKSVVNKNRKLTNFPRFLNPNETKPHKSEKCAFRQSKQNMVDLTEDEDDSTKLSVKRYQRNQTNFKKQQKTTLTLLTQRERKKITKQ
jgi:hypothetical protein